MNKTGLHTFTWVDIEAAELALRQPMRAWEVRRAATYARSVAMSPNTPEGRSSQTCHE
jgi:hypothetical protein